MRDERDRRDGVIWFNQTHEAKHLGQADKNNQTNPRNKRNKSVLGGQWDGRCGQRIAQAEQDHFQRHVEVEVPSGSLLGQFNFTEQLQ